MEYALITGASSGFGYQFAKLLAQKSYNLILVARRKNRLEELKKELSTDVVIFDYDLSIESNCYLLFEQIKNYNVKFFINNAGYGTTGEFKDTSLSNELGMINLNIKAVHILTKLFIQNFDDQNKRHLINVSSLAGLLEGPYMATYYATKNYVRVLTNSLAYELKKNNSKIVVSCLCPGPVNTEFNKRANVKFLGALSNKFMAVNAQKVASYAIKKASKGTLIIIPGIKERIGYKISCLMPKRIIRWFISKHQRRKM